MELRASKLPTSRNRRLSRTVLLMASLLLASLAIWLFYILVVNEPVFVEREDIGGGPTSFPLVMVFGDGNVIYTHFSGNEYETNHFQLDEITQNGLKRAISRIEDRTKTRFQIDNETDQGDIAFYIKGSRKSSFWDVYPYYTDPPDPEGRLAKTLDWLNSLLIAAGGEDVVSLLSIVKSIRPRETKSDSLMDRIVVLRWKERIPAYVERIF